MHKLFHSLAAAQSAAGGVDDQLDDHLSANPGVLCNHRKASVPQDLLEEIVALKWLPGTKCNDVNVNDLLAVPWVLNNVTWGVHRHPHEMPLYGQARWLYCYGGSTVVA